MIRASLCTGVALSLGCVLSACAVGPDFKRPAPPAATGYGTAPARGATASAEASGGTAQHFVESLDIPGEWWTLFQSPKLNHLVEEALKSNPDAAAAQAALRQAHELYLAQRTSFFPGAQGSFGANRSEFPTDTLTSPITASSSTYTLYTAQLSLSYAPDVFGLTRRQVEIAKAQFDSSRFQLQATYLTLTSNVVVTAVQEASLRGQIAATTRLLELQRQLTETARQQRLAGSAAGALVPDR